MLILILFISFNAQVSFADSLTQDIADSLYSENVYYNQDPERQEREFANKRWDAPWNNPIKRDDITAPWNNPIKRDDITAPWNHPLGGIDFDY